MGIRKQGDKWEWNTAFKRKRMWGMASTEIEAQQALDDAKAKLLQDWQDAQAAVPLEAVPTGGGWTLAKAIEKAFEVRWAGEKSEHTNQKNTAQLLKYFGRSRPLVSITTDDVDTFKEACRKAGNSNGTINRKMACLSVIFKVAMERGVVAAKPLTKYKSEGTSRVRYLSTDEEATVLATLKQWGKTDVWDAVVVLVDTGMRLGELLKLTPQDYDPTRGLVHVIDPKNGVNRSVPLTSRAKAILGTRVAGAEKRTDRLWKCSGATVDHVWAKVRLAMGLEADSQFVVHSLRHTCASRLVQRGIALPVVMAWMGHQDIKTTMIYAHLCPANLMAALSVLEPSQTA